MQLFRVSNIVWDVDDEGDNDEASEALNLPTGGYVHAESEDEVADALSDELGWCIKSLDVELATDVLVFVS